MQSSKNHNLSSVYPNFANKICMETLGHVEYFPAVSIHFQIFCIEQYYRNVLKCIRGRIVYPKNDFYAFSFAKCSYPSPLSNGTSK